MYIKKNRTKLS